MISILDPILLTASVINIVVIALMIIKNKKNIAMWLSIVQAVVWAIRLSYPYIKW